MYSVSVTLNHLFTGLHCVVLTEWVCYWSEVNLDSHLSGKITEGKCRKTNDL